jgi:hypothetical protein
MHTDHPFLCPVRLWGKILRRIWTYPDATAETTVNAWLDPDSNQLRFIQGLDVLHALRRSCLLDGGKPTYGYSPDEIGTHSIRSGAAMALFLANESVLKIMILGRWSSDAFLVYIRPQVLEWTANMSTSMVKNLDFHHVDHSQIHEGAALQANIERAHDELQTQFNGGPPSLQFHAISVHH